MFQAMQGTLAADPKVEQITGPDKRVFTAATVQILYHDGRSGSEPCIVHALAWNEQARHLAEHYKAGDEIQFIGRLNAAPAKHHGETALTFTIQSIDDSRTLVSAVEQFLKDFVPAKDRLTEKIQTAEQQTESIHTGREPEQSI